MTLLRQRSANGRLDEEAELPQIDVEFILPMRAERWLAEHDEAVERGLIRRNRKIKSQHVAEYADAMSRGTWRLNGESIKFDQDGILMDGEHRLRACVEAGSAFQSRVERGLDRSTRETVDAGVPRRARDVIYEMGSSDAGTVTSAIRYILMFKRFGGFYVSSVGSMDRPGRQQIIDSYREFGSRVDAMVGQLHAPHLTRSLVAAIRFVAEENGLGDEAYEFFHSVVTGDGLRKGDPAFALRERLLRVKMDKQKRPSPTVLAAWYVKAFNAYARGDRMEVLRFRIAEPHAESFPIVATAEEVQ